MTCSYKPAIASLSLGRAWVHDIHSKFIAAATAGLTGIEIFYEDLIYLASKMPGGLTEENQLLAARQIRRLCDSLELEIIGIGPFNNCDGLLDPIARAAKLVELRLWFKVARIMGTNTIQIPSTFLTKGVTGDRDIIVRDMREIADIGAAEQPPFKFAYENLCFATFNNTWEKAWDIVKGVDRDNFGLCLDTFNIAGRAWADPAEPSGTIPNADEMFHKSMTAMIEEVDVRKVFYIQIVDAEKLSAPLDENHPFYVAEQTPRMSWSRNCRLFMCEENRGGYLPVMDVMRAICDGLGYKGWVSMELFNRSLVETADVVPREHAQRAIDSWHEVCRAMQWDEPVVTAQDERKFGHIRHPSHGFELKVGDEIIARL